jgi:UDP-glucose 4-epimerase
MTEMMLRDTALAHDLNYVVLRYFNVAGADPKLRTGQSNRAATHLVKVAVQAALGVRNGMEIFGTDYPTPDGTCIRDYIHISDLVVAHIEALNYLRGGGASATLNCGYGHGYSVREVVEAVKRVSGTDFVVTTRARRLGDPPSIIADTQAIRRVLSWRPAYDDLETIVRHALAWERTLLAQT